MASLNLQSDYQREARGKLWQMQLPSQLVTHD
jgi:hypothetical protein